MRRRTLIMPYGLRGRVSPLLRAAAALSSISVMTPHNEVFEHYPAMQHDELPEQNRLELRPFTASTMTNILYPLPGSVPYIEGLEGIQYFEPEIILFHDVVPEKPLDPTVGDLQSLLSVLGLALSSAFMLRFAYKHHVQNILSRLALELRKLELKDYISFLIPLAGIAIQNHSGGIKSLVVENLSRLEQVFEEELCPIIKGFGESLNEISASMRDITEALKDLSASMRDIIEALKYLKDYIPANNIQIECNQSESGGPPSVEQQVESGEPTAAERNVESGEPPAAERKVESGEPSTVEQKQDSGEPAAVEPKGDSGQPAAVERRGQSGEPAPVEQKGDFLVINLPCHGRKGYRISLSPY